ncbi:MAG: recombinase family protein [Flavisolibacter sp.]
MGSTGFRNQRISEILQNPFYFGLLSLSLLEGEMVEGKHEKLVSKSNS